jgi:iron complex transport system substrate-binding protein
MTIGKKSFLNDFISYAGGKNIGADMDKDYIKCSQEWVILANPEVIICPAMGEGKSGEVIARYGWQNIPAVKNKHVFTHLNQDLIYRLGPRMLDGIAIIRKCIESADSK